MLANPSGGAFWGVGVRPLACWNCGFESRWGYGRLSVVSVGCCHVEVSATSRSLVWCSPAECVSVSLSVIRCYIKPLHCKVYLDRRQTKRKERKHNARLQGCGTSLLCSSGDSVCMGLSSRRVRIRQPYLESVTSANP
jgi:hypothetical protein